MTFADHNGDLPDDESSQSGSRYAAIFSKSPVHSSSTDSPFVRIVSLPREVPGAVICVLSALWCGTLCGPAWGYLWTGLVFCLSAVASLGLSPEEGGREGLLHPFSALLNWQASMLPY